MLLLFFFAHNIVATSIVSTIITRPSFSSLRSCAVSSDGTIYWNERYGHGINSMTPDGTVALYSAGKFWGLVIDSHDTLFALHASTRDIVRFTPDGNYSTFASVEGTAFLAIDMQDNLYVQSGTTILQISPTATIGVLFDTKKPIQGLVAAPDGSIIFSSGNALFQFQNQEIQTLGGSASGYVDGPVDQAQFSQPGALGTDELGTIYIADQDGTTIRMLSNGQVTTFAGTGLAGIQDGLGTVATFQAVSGFAIDTNGQLLITDWKAQQIRAVACEKSYFGITCAMQGQVPSTCHGKATFHRFSGEMISCTACAPGHTGNTCEPFGLHCDPTGKINSNELRCTKCLPGYYGYHCQYQGNATDTNCATSATIQFDHFSGAVLQCGACQPGFTGSICDIPTTTTPSKVSKWLIGIGITVSIPAVVFTLLFCRSRFHTKPIGTPRSAPFTELQV